MSAAAAAAVDALHDICTNGESPRDRIRAADTLLAYQLKYSERADLEARRRRLESGFPPTGGAA